MKQQQEQTNPIDHRLKYGNLEEQQSDHHPDGNFRSPAGLNKGGGMGVPPCYEQRSFNGGQQRHNSNDRG